MKFNPMYKLTNLAISTVLLCTIALTANANGLTERNAIQAKVKTALLEENFAELEKLAHEYRSGKARTSSGVWNMAAFDSGINDAFNPLNQSNLANIEAKAKKWVEAYPNSAEAHIAYAEAMKESYELYTQPKNASELPADLNSPYYQYLALADAYLDQNKTVASANPNWYVDKLIIARLQHWNRAKFDALLKEALTKHPNFYSIHFYAATYLLPQWYGSFAEIEKLANHAAAITKNNRGDGMYARVYWSVTAQAELGSSIFLKTQANWPKMKAGFEDIIQRYPDDWNLNNYARFACLAQDKAKTAELMQAIEGKEIFEAWDSIELFQYCRQ